MTPAETVQWLDGELQIHAEQFGKRSAVLLEMVVGIRMFLRGMHKVFEDEAVMKILNVQCASIITSASILADFPPTQIDLILEKATELSTGVTERMDDDGFIVMADGMSDGGTKH